MTNVQNTEETMKALAIEVQKANNQKKQALPAGDAMYAAFYVIVQSMQVQQQSAQVQATNLEVNGDEQVKINNEQSQLHFQVVSSDLKGDALNNKLMELQGVNDNINAEFQMWTNMDMLTRQQAQQAEDMFNGTVNYAERDVNQGASLLQNIQSLARATNK